MKIGIVGSQGFFGKTLCETSKELGFDVVEITKKNYSENKGKRYEVLINSATNSKKYWALNNPFLDFNKTVDLTADLVYNWNFDKFVQISSISAHEYDSGHPYTVNKRTAEIICSYTNSLIVRLGTPYGNYLNKGALYDLLNSNKIFVNINSEYDFISTNFCAKWILKNLDRKGIVELGASDTLSLMDIANKLNLKPEYEGKKIIIHSDRTEENMPNVKEVWSFIDDQMRKIKN